AVEVVAPKGSIPEDIEGRLRKRARWIIRQLRYFDQFRPRSTPLRYVGGETHLYLGRQYRLKVLKSMRDDVRLKGGLLIVSSANPTNRHRVQRLVERWYREKAKARILERFKVIVRRFARIGSPPSEPTFRSMPRRWGSYTKTGRILLNPDLIRAP